MSSWEPFLSALGKYSWRSMVGVFAATGAVLFFQHRLGVSEWLQPIRPWVIIAFIASGAVLLTHVVTYSVHQLGKRRPKGTIHFVPDAYNTGWSKQHETEMNVRISGTFTYTGPGDLIILRAFLKGSTLAPDLMAQIPATDGSGKLIATSALWLHQGIGQQAFLSLRLTPVLGTPGEQLRREMYFRDSLNRDFPIGMIEFPYIGR